MKSPDRRWRRSRGYFLVPLAIASLPLIAFFAYTTWLNPISPFYANYDPEFPYLMNSLEVFKGKPYAYVDHPGTPLEVIGTVIYAATFPILGKAPDAFIRYHLEHPGLFLTLAHGFLLLASIGCIWYFVTGEPASRRPFYSLETAALALMFYVVHPLSFPSIVVWSHNSFSFAAGTLLLLYLFKKLHGGKPPGKIPVREWILPGVAAGVMASITIYLTAWAICIMTVIAILYWMHKIPWQKTLAALLTVSFSSVAGFALSVLPVMGKMSMFFFWIRALLTHENQYRIIAPNQPGLLRLSTNFIDLFHQLPILFVSTSAIVVLAFIGLATLRRRSHQPQELVALAWGLIVQIGLLTLFILDHPKAEYMLSVAAITPVLAMAVLELFETQPAIRLGLGRVLVVLVFVGLAFSLYQAFSTHQANVTKISRIEVQTSQSRQEYAKSLGRAPADLFVIWTYRSYSPCFSLWFGNDSTDRVYRKEIGQICYRQYEFNIWSQKVVSSQGVSKLDDTKWDVLIGCEDGFNTSGLTNLPEVETFSSLNLTCGSLKIAYNRN